MNRIETRFERAIDSLDYPWPDSWVDSWLDCGLDSDACGVMTGLTAAETNEFIALDARNYVDENGNPFSWPWDTTGEAKNRWLTLFEKHEAALKRIKVLERLRGYHK